MNIENIDQSYDDKSRRWHGAFFTPPIWAKKAQDYISSVYGDDWTQKYAVYDPCCSTKNLTAGVHFKELYQSTINQEELDYAKNINPEAKCRLAYDFLSEMDLPRELDGFKTAIAQNRAIWFLNPPFGSDGSYKIKEGAENKKDITKNTLIYNEMKNLGKASANLYSQFLYKIIGIGGKICFFSNPTFPTSGSFKKFREFLFSEYKFVKGFLFPASEFEGASNQWGIVFSIWEPGEQENKNEIEVDILKNHSGNIEKIGTKVLYNLDETQSINKWYSSSLPKYKRIDLPQLSTGISIKQNGMGNNFEENIGYIVSGGNAIYYNNQDSYIINSTSSRGKGFPIIPKNFLKCCSLFTARRTITGQYANWINNKDEYSIPDTDHPDYPQWNLDCIVYSLFNTASNQSSLRDVIYKDKIWQILNHWFWMSKKEMMKLADENDNPLVYQDAKTDKDRFVYNYLQNITLSPDAQRVLDLASNLVRKTFPFRNMARDQHPEWYTQTWDAGWYQIKLLLKTYLKEDLKNFREEYKILENRLRDGVYKFGFLRR